MKLKDLFIILILFSTLQLFGQERYSDSMGNSVSVSRSGDCMTVEYNGDEYLFKRIGMAAPNGVETYMLSGIGSGTLIINNLSGLMTLMLNGTAMNLFRSGSNSNYSSDDNSYKKSSNRQLVKVQCYSVTGPEKIRARNIRPISEMESSTTKRNVKSAEVMKCIIIKNVPHARGRGILKSFSKFYAISLTPDRGLSCRFFQDGIRYAALK